jgi:hypothetical protein
MRKPQNAPMILFLSLLLVLVNLSVCSAAYYTFRMTAPADSEALKYADAKLYFSFSIARKNPDRLLLSVYNRTDAAVTVDWSQSSLIFDQTAHTILPGAQIFAAGGLQTASAATVPPGARFEETLLAGGSVNLVTIPPFRYGLFYPWRPGWGWLGFDDFYLHPGYQKLKIKPFFPDRKRDLAEQNLVGEEFSLFLPVTIGEETVNYKFSFVVTSASPDVSPGLLGVLLTDGEEQAVMTKEVTAQEGALITALSPRGAAKRAGLLAGDVIIKINGQSVRRLEDFFVLLNRAKARDIMTIDYLRQGKENAVAVELGKA